MLTEVRERFALAIVAKVPIEHIVEIHFFHPIRQGGVESGVAVLAADLPAAPPQTAQAEGSVPDGPARETRYTVYSARYRLMLKGPERGKWEMSIRPEADAPLPTVDAVVQGVLRRAGDAEIVERMSGEELRAQLHAASRT